MTHSQLRPSILVPSLPVPDADTERGENILAMYSTFFTAGSKGSRDLFRKYMKLGYVESRIGKMLVYGACGTGKSSFMDLMVGNPQKNIRKSTPLAARPVAIFQLGVSNEKKWAKLSEKERKEILVQALMSMQSQQDQEEMSESEEEDLSGRGQ